MSGRENREGLNRAYGKASFNITVGHATGVRKPVGKQKFNGCTVISIPQPNGHKPHMAVKNRQGDIIFDYMERYIRAIEKLAIADVVKYKDKLIETTRQIVGA